MSQTKLHWFTMQNMLQTWYSNGALMPANCNQHWINQQAPFLIIFMLSGQAFMLIINSLNWSLAFGVDSTHNSSNYPQIAPPFNNYSRQATQTFDWRRSLIKLESFYNYVLMDWCLVFLWTVCVFSGIEILRLFFILKSNIKQAILFNSKQCELYNGAIRSYRGGGDDDDGGDFGSTKCSCVSGELAESAAAPNKAKSPPPKLTIQSSTEQKLILDVNARMLFCIISYKIFMTQLEPIICGVCWIVPCITFAAFSGPAVFMLHALYVADSFNAQEKQAAFKTNMLIMSVLIIVVTLASFLLVSLSYGRGVSLNKHLNSLLCHMLATKINRQQAANVNPYDGYLIYALERELHWPESMLDRFKALGIRFTYGQFIRFVFYVGIVLTFTSLQGTVNLNNRAFERNNNFINDPFALFRD